MNNKIYSFGIKSLVIVCLMLFSNNLFSQARIVVTCNTVTTNLNTDCDGLLSGDSDFVWEFQATDNTVGLTNNNPEIPLTDKNFHNINDNNGPYSQTINETFFDWEYACPSTLPTQISIDWNAYENDDPTNFGTVLFEGETGNQNAMMAVPTVGNTTTMTYSATGASGCGQEYEITFTVETFAYSNAGTLADDICNANIIPVDGNDYDFSWCGDGTFETNEPDGGNDITNNGTAWLYFTAPASGAVDISTDITSTEFGTEVYVYHAADGAGCTQGNDPYGNFVKDKFDYLSYMTEADLGGLLNLEGEADVEMSSCTQTAIDAGLFAPRLVAGETYYIQISTDDANQFGVIGLNISDADNGGTPADNSDIPCTSTSRPIGQTVQEDGVTAPTFTITNGCSFDQEVEGSLAEAYPINNPLSNDNLTETNWFNFTAPCSGAIYFETNIFLQGESSYLMGHDPRFAPGTPTDHSCANLVIPRNDFNMHYGDGGALGGSTAVLQATCLEPGYTYYGMVDPTTLSIGSVDVWLYDPGSAAPPNDILCLTLGDANFEVPVQTLGNPTTPAVSGNNTNGCYEQLAGEPLSSMTSNPATQTVWHYFTAPPSGVVDIDFAAGTIGQMNINVYPTLDGTTAGCYGGLYNDATGCPSPDGTVGSTYTADGTQSTLPIESLGFGTANNTGSSIQVCCLIPGDVYAIQVDGAAPGDEGSYSIDNISEVEVVAGNTSYTDEDGDTFDANSASPSLVCFNEIITASSANSIIPSSGCMDEGFILHDTQNPTQPYNGITVYDSNSPGNGGVFTNDGSQPTPAPYNTIIYVSTLLDNVSAWGTYCPSAEITDAVPVVFLEEITFSNLTIDNALCKIDLTINGGLPAYDGSVYTYTITAGGITYDSGTTTGDITFMAPNNITYTVTVIDNEGCAATTTIDASAISCMSDCGQYQQITIQPNPIDNTVYNCNPDGTATVTLTLSGGKPEFDGNGDYTITLSGSSITADGVYNSNGTTYMFTVSDGDNWMVSVTDEDDCNAATATDIFDFDSTDCPNLCALNPISLGNGFVYACDGNGQATVTININGGLPSIDGGTTGYTLTLSGSSASTNGTNTGVGNTFIFTVNSGDNWTISVTDDLNCTAAIATDVFTQDPDNDCAATCATLNNIVVNGDDSYEYTCDNGQGNVSVSITGGLPEADGGATNYILMVTKNGVTTTITLSGNTYDLMLNDGDTWNIVATDQLGCTAVDLGGGMNNTFSSPTADAGMDVEIYPGEEVALNGDGGTSAMWSPATNLDDPTSYTPMANPMETTTYTLTVSDNGGCESSDEVTVIVKDKFDCLQGNTGLTPNGDGIHDTWNIPCIFYFENDIQIFNRWGQVVQEFHNYQNDWDGTVDGKPLPDATYYFMIKLSAPTDKRVIKGTVTIIR